MYAFEMTLSAQNKNADADLDKQNNKCSKYILDYYVYVGPLWRESISPKVVERILFCLNYGSSSVSESLGNLFLFRNFKTIYSFIFFKKSINFILDFLEQWNFGNNIIIWFTFLFPCLLWAGGLSGIGGLERVGDQHAYLYI